MDNEDIIVVSEKRHIEKLNYKIWPGDEKDDNQDVNNNYYISNKPSDLVNTERESKFKNTEYHQGKRKRDNNENTENEAPAKRPNMSNRYFSSENLKIIAESKEIADSKKSSNAAESEKFTKRRDYLIKRLLQNRSLPGIEEKNQENSSCEEIIPEEESDEEIKIVNKTRKHDFQDEFIPLFQSGSGQKEKLKNDEEKEKDIDNSFYSGPYPYRCLSKAKEAILEAFRPIPGATYTNRVAEIAKMKINLPSKFDHDKRLWSRIKRETYQIRQQLRDRIETYQRHEARMLAKKSTKIEFIELDGDSDEDSEENETTVIKMINSQNKKNKNKHLKFDDDDSDIDENGILSDDLVQMNDENSDESDLDSKCVQFGKYSKQAKNLKKKKNNKFSSGSSSGLKCESVDYTPRLKQKNKKNNNNIDDDELDLLKLEYRRLRNARNKAMRSIKNKVKDGASKQMSLEIEREIMNEKMTKVRRMIKKLNRKNRPKSAKKMSTLENSDSSSVAIVKKFKLKKESKKNSDVNKTNFKKQQPNSNDVLKKNKKFKKKKSNRKQMNKIKF
ncbi:unnamed protein product [Brachionus calyciflorus]|uniref:Uncharacterized protein n=1 Tax=Brachionus calyciflorus TaxID=104777 RepID=A0A813M085_9BILA|nr:unnamed protein product [Brachionus calyciflorus]